MNTPEISVQDLENILKSEQEFVLLDVREPWELARATGNDSRLYLAPLSLLSQRGAEILPETKLLKTIVVCHHGICSVHVADWLLSQGWAEVFSLRGGIEFYALHVDPTIGRY